MRDPQNNQNRDSMKYDHIVIPDGDKITVVVGAYTSSSGNFTSTGFEFTSEEIRNQAGFETSMGFNIHDEIGRAHV